MTPIAAIRRSERAAAAEVLRLVRMSLGTWTALRVVVRVAAGTVRGEPFRQLGAPRDERDRLSRRQARGVVLLHRALAPHLGRERARDLVGRVVTVGGVDFLERMVPALPAERLAERADALLAGFFNAEGDVVAEPGGPIRFTVRRCRFVELLNAVGEADLAPLFCEVDERFFREGRRPIVLGRTRTLATGGESCDFTFTAPEP